MGAQGDHPTRLRRENDPAGGAIQDGFGSSFLQETGRGKEGRGGGRTSRSFARGGDAPSPPPLPLPPQEIGGGHQPGGFGKNSIGRCRPPAAPEKTVLFLYFRNSFV